MEKIPFTAAGLEVIKNELAHLKNSERQAVINAIAAAREHGDLSENAEYHAAREKQSFIEGRISELEDVTSRAEVIDASQLSDDKVTFGTSVSLADEETDDVPDERARACEETQNEMQWQRRQLLTTGRRCSRAVSGTSSKARGGVRLQAGPCDFGWIPRPIAEGWTV